MRGARGNLLLVVLAVLAIGTAGFALKRAPSQQPYNGPQAKSYVYTHEVYPQVAFLGDSYTGGSKMSSGPNALYPALLANRFRWNVNNDGEGGTGFVASGTGQPFGARVEEVASQKPDIVVVWAARNDEHSAGQVRSAALDVLQRLRTALPKAKIVVVGPAWTSSNPPGNFYEIRNEERTAANQLGLPFIDPLAESWFVAPDSALIGSDGVHPTDAGHTYIAQRLGDDLIRLKVATPAARP